jgi:hypothetical protein
MFMSAQACFLRRRGKRLRQAAGPLAQAENSGRIAARIDLAGSRTNKLSG